jgi:hypothetical protein
MIPMIAMWQKQKWCWVSKTYSRSSGSEGIRYGNVNDVDKALAYDLKTYRIIRILLLNYNLNLNKY